MAVSRWARPSRHRKLISINNVCFSRYDLMNRSPGKVVMHQTPIRLSRRTFLRGTGAAIALPWLNAMAQGSPTDASMPPVRFGCLYFPNGAFMANWTPTTTGTNYQLPSSLAPLESVKDKLLILSGLDKKNSHEGDGHYAKTANFLTGLHVNKTTGREISAGGTSMDQLMAQKVGNRTPLPSLELGIDPIVSGVDTNVGYTRLYASYIAWRGPNVPVAREINPRAVYDRLFASKDTSARAADDDRSLLDAALGDANDLRNRLGRDDQVKMDEYLESVRAVEKQIEFSTRSGGRDWTPLTQPTDFAAPEARIPSDYQKHVRLMLDLIMLSFWTDQTRVATFMFANDVSPRNFSQYIAGVKGGHHEMSHHQNNADKIRQYSLINRWHTGEFARLLERMRDVSEGESTLLDNSMILMGSGMSDGNRHDPANLPILLAGGGGLTLQTGRHISYPQGTPLCNLHVSLLDRMGVELPRFGDSTQRLAELDA